MIMGDRKSTAADFRVHIKESAEGVPFMGGIESLTGAPKCPEWLLSEARHAWRRAAKHLVDRGVLTSIDLTSFGLCCQSYGRWRIAKREMKICGADAQNALAKIAKMEWKFFEALCKDFWLSPADFLQIAEGDDDPQMPHAASDTNGV
jgi:hypothetical protein